MADGKTRISLAEAKRLHPDEWVVLANPRFDQDDQLIDGELIFHSPDGDLASRASGQFDGDCAMDFTGTPRYRSVTLHGKDAVNKPAA